MSLIESNHFRSHSVIWQKLDPDVAFNVVVSSGVTSSGLTLSPTEYEEVLSGGMALSNTVDSGGLVTVDAGGVTTSDTILSGGAEVVSAGGLASDVTVSAGGLISGAGLVDGGAIYGFAAGLSVGPAHFIESDLEIESGGVASSIRVVNEGILGVDPSGSAQATIVSNGGFLSVASGGTASGTIVSSGGGVLVNGEADSTQLRSSAYAFVGAADSTTSAVLSSVVVSSGAYLEIASGGLGSAVKLYQGAAAVVETEGAISNVTVQGASLSVSFEGDAGDITVTSGGALMVQKDGVVRDVQIVSGTISLGALGVAYGLSVSAGGTLIENGFVEDGEIVDGVGRETLAGRRSGTGILIQVGSGVLDLAGNASAFTGEVLIAGGTVLVGSKPGLVSGSVFFDQTVASGAVCALELATANQPVSGAVYGATLSDFNNSQDRLDLVGLAYVSGATAKVTGDVLRLTDGAYTASFALDDSKATRYVVEPDGGGTLIRAAINAPTVSLVHAAAAFPAASAGAGLLSAHEIQSRRVELLADSANGMAKHGFA